MECYWRIRMKFKGDDLNRVAWERSEVGIWYGAWSADDLRQALRAGKAVEYLGALPQQVQLGWTLKPKWIATAKRFSEITSSDWVVVYFGNTLHFGRVTTEVLSDGDHPLNRERQLFKFRKVTEKKTFSLSRLPDSYRLIPSAGRGNVHQFNETNWELVQLLAQSDDEGHVLKAFEGMSLRQRLDILSPGGWESLSLGYLILEEEFLPTGLAVGRTLRDLDIVGRGRGGVRILAQCKKDSASREIEPSFLEACDGCESSDRIFYFAYGGCKNPPPSVRVVSRSDIERWAEADPGRGYLQWFFGR